MANFDFYLCLRINFHTSSFWALILPARGPYRVLISQKTWVLVGSLSQSLEVLFSFRGSEQESINGDIISLSSVQNSCNSGSLISFYTLNSCEEYQLGLHVFNAMREKCNTCVKDTEIHLTYYLFPLTRLSLVFLTDGFRHQSSACAFLWAKLGFKFIDR